jgi:hypothetical protein
LSSQHRAKDSNGKVAFNIIRGCKTKDYPDGNGAIAWDRLKNKYEPVSVPSMVKLEKQFRELSLKSIEERIQIEQKLINVVLD